MLKRIFDDCVSYLKNANTVKPLIVNTPPLWTTCHCERFGVPPSGFCWFWPPPLRAPHDSEIWTLFLVPTVYIASLFWTSIGGATLKNWLLWISLAIKHYWVIV